MQMGPASLPTPLSPACGHPSLCNLPANLPMCLLRGILGARCLAPMRSVLRLPAPGFVTGARAGIRLSLLPCRVPLSPEGSAFRCHAHSLGRDRVPLPIRYAAFPACAFFASSGLQPGSWPVRFHRVAPVSNDPACVWPKPPSCRLSMGAWTDVTAILGIKTPVTSRPCGFPFRLLRVPKTS